MSQLPQFVLPTLNDHPFGWGPSAATAAAGATATSSRTGASTHTATPHTDFKGERLGLISDWTNPNKSKGQRMGSSGVSMFDPKREDDEASFSLVDTMRQKSTKVRYFVPRTTVGRGGRGGAQRGRNTYVTSFQRQGTGFNAGGRGGSGSGAGGRGGRGGLVSTRGRGGYRGGYREETPKEPSVRVQPNWTLAEEVDFEQLASSNIPPSTSETLYDAGVLPRYQDALDKVVRPRTSKPIPAVPVVSYPPASADPIFQRIASEKAGQVFASEAVLSMLMVAPQTTYGWEVLVRKVSDSEIYLDSRPGSRVDQPPVCENTLEQLPTDPESTFSAVNLANELERVQKSVANLVTSSSAVTTPAPGAPIALDLQHPFSEGEAKNGILYRRWSYSDNLNVIVRSVIDAHVPTEGDTSKYVVSRTQVEVDSKTLTGTVFDWKDKLENQQTAVLLAEMKTNPTRFARMAVEAYLADADIIKLSFASRVSVRDNTKHSLLLTMNLEPRELLTHKLKLTLRPLFGSLRVLIDKIRAMPNGKYVIMRDPNRSVVQIYSLPEDGYDHTTGEIAYTE